MNGWRPPRSSADRRLWAWIGTGALICYASSYAAFSVWGQYVPAQWPHRQAGMTPMTYLWAPGEFYDYHQHRWHTSHTVFYFPLLWLDRRYWHSDDGALGGRYPVVTPPTQNVANDPASQK